MPTSITTAPGFTIVGRHELGEPMAAIRMSARRVTSARFLVRLWQIGDRRVGRQVPSWHQHQGHRLAHDLAATQHHDLRSRDRIVRDSSKSRCMPCGVQGKKRGGPARCGRRSPDGRRRRPYRRDGVEHRDCGRSAWEGATGRGCRGCPVLVALGDERQQFVFARRRREPMQRAFQSRFSQAFCLPRT